jgi:hypothetical protein
MGDVSDFQRGQIVMFSCSIHNQTATSLAVSRAAVPKVMTAYTNHGRTSSAERNSGHKPEVRERDCGTLNRIVSIYHRSTAAKATAELNNHLEDPVSTKKSSNMSFINPTSTGQLQLLNL